MAALLRAHDWSATALGPIHGWPQSLRSALSICLRSPSATAIAWGPELLFLYNDAWSRFLGPRHPGALGRPAAEVMADVWTTLEPQFRTAMEQAQAVNVVDALLERNLGGATFDSWWSYSLLPVASEDGSGGGGRAHAREATGGAWRGGMRGGAPVGGLGGWCRLPVASEGGGVGGVLAQARETTESVLRAGR